MRQKQFSDQLIKAREAPVHPEGQNISERMIGLLASMGFQIEKIDHPASPRARVNAINVVRELLLEVIDFVNKYSQDPQATYDRNELTELIDELSRTEKLVGRETWMGLIGVQTQFRADQDTAYELLKDEVVEFLRSLFDRFEDWIEDHHSNPEWDSSCETLLEELSSHW